MNIDPAQDFKVRRRLSRLFLLMVAALTTRAAAAPEVSFSQDIAPIFLKKCIGCHGSEKAKGGFRLHTYGWLLKKGDGERLPIQPGQPGESEVFVRITSLDEDDRMPQKDDPLSSAHVKLIERWIAEGARFDGEDPDAALQTLAPQELVSAPPSVYPRPIPILSLAFDPAGARLAASGYHEVTLWDPTNGTLQARWNGLPERIHNVAFSPDGAWLAVGGGAPGQYGELLLLDARNGEVTKRLGRTTDCVLAVCFTADGRFVAAGGADHSIRVYELPEGKEHLLIQQHADWVMGLAVDAEGRHLASASRDGTARVYSLENGELEATHHDHQAPVWAVAFSGETVLSGGADKEVHVWTLPEGKKAGELRGWSGDVYELVTHHDMLFAAGGFVRQYQVADRKLVREFSGTEDTVYSLAYDPGAGLLAAGCHNGMVYLWREQDGISVKAFPAWPSQ